MISDILYEAVMEIDRYLHHDDYEGTYTGSLRERIKACRNEMDAIRLALDTPPVVQ